MAGKAKVPEVEIPSTDDVAAELARLGAELQQVAGDVVARQTKLKEVEEFLGRLQVKDFPDLAESPVVQSFVKLFGGTVDMRPGEVQRRGTLAEREREWTYRDLTQFELVKFVPAENIPITFNGLTVYLTADQESEVPRPFYDIYMEHRKAIRQAQINEKFLLGLSDVPPDQNWMTDESARVRAWSTQGRHLGRQSGHIGVGPIHGAGEVAPEEEKGA